MVESTDHAMNLDNWIKLRNYSDLIHCSSLFNKNSTASTKVKYQSKMCRRKPIKDFHFINITTDCEKFKQKRGYILESNITKEDYFPIAYSILFYKELEQVEFLLRAIYRPQNIYCLHLDKFYSKVTNFP